MHGQLGVGLLGCGFMGRAHTSALARMRHVYDEGGALPSLAAVCGIPREEVARFAAQHGFENYYTDWRSMIEDQHVTVLDNAGPNSLHLEPSIAAAKRGKHVLCEKPLARNAAEAKEMLRAVEAAGVKHMCGFVYRFVPAIRLAREMLLAGELGEVYHFRARYLQDWGIGTSPEESWKFNRKEAGSGALGDLGSHLIDLARFLVGEIEWVSAETAYFPPGGRLTVGGGEHGQGVDGAFAAVVRFANGAMGTLESSRFALGRKNQNTFEINAAKGSLVFDLERLNELQVHHGMGDRHTGGGFARILVTEENHPFIGHWWPPGHVIGWEHAFVHEIQHFLDAVAHDTSIGPDGATFTDGYRCAVVCDAIAESARDGRRVVLAD